MEKVDCVVVGAGVVGLAVARALAQRGREIIILEATGSIGSETSSRNNEVIHAGFLYPKGSLKARLCRPGRDMLYRYCAERGIANRRIGKLVIATNDDETLLLDRIGAAARDHGVDDVACLDGPSVRRVEPAITCLGALHSPSTGILDAHALMLSLLGDAEAAGAVIAYNTRVAGGAVRDGSIDIRTEGGTSGGYAFSCRTLVNAAGLGARDIALAYAAEAGAVSPVYYAKGNFFAFGGRLPFRHVIAPLGSTLEMGGAFTLDIGGQGKFGPDVEWVDAVDYRVDAARATRFEAAIRRYYPDLPRDALRPGYSGIRPRPSMSAVTDWLILGPRDHGQHGLFHLLGFDTPGLTACLAIGEHVADMVGSA
jgi:L-2-hydroxyglutarate oxidase LhgO